MIYPSLRYRDARAGIDWLKDTFGFEERVVYANDDGTVAHAELSFGPSIVMLGSEKDDSYGSHVGEGWLYVAVPDPDERFAVAKKIVERHGGTITAEAVVGGGATFIINLPEVPETNHG